MPDSPRPPVLVVDYGRGNLFGLVRALQAVGCEPTISDNPKALKDAERIVLPGVGAFGDAVGELGRRGFIEPMREAASSGTPLLGICVGCQLLLESGEEHGVFRGLGLLGGVVRRLPEPNDSASPWRVPNVGWRSVVPTRADTIVSDVKGDRMVYFVHSYAPVVNDPAVVAAVLSFNGAEIPVALQQRNIAGVQFHPERSGEVGLGILRKFADLKAR